MEDVGFGGIPIGGMPMFSETTVLPPYLPTFLCSYFTDDLIDEIATNPKVGENCLTNREVGLVQYALWILHTAKEG